MEDSYIMHNAAITVLRTSLQDNMCYVPRKSGKMRALPDSAYAVVDLSHRLLTQQTR